MIYPSIGIKYVPTCIHILINKLQDRFFFLPLCPSCDSSHTDHWRSTLTLRTLVLNSSDFLDFQFGN